jgi:hypothetical protein
MRATRCRSPRRGWATCWTPLKHVYRVLGFEDVACGDEVFRHLMLARIIEPASKLDSLRVLEEADVAAAF